MLCQECRRKSASVKITAIIDNQKSELHLCDECARSRGEPEFGTEAKLSIGEMLAALLHHQGTLKPAGASVDGGEDAAEQRQRCPTCGLTYHSFTKQGKLGCSACYEEFDRQMRGVLRHVHGSTRHVGRSPRRAGGAARVRRRIDELRVLLGESVRAQQFERAAELRDEIRQLEGQLRRSSDDEASPGPSVAPAAGPSVAPHAPGPSVAPEAGPPAGGPGATPDGMPVGPAADEAKEEPR
jgi:protein arginine kinase activator